MAKNRYGVCWAMAMLAIAVFAVPARAMDKDAPAQFTVTVVDDGGKGIEGATVELLRPAVGFDPPESIAIGKTDVQGQAKLLGKLRPGMLTDNVNVSASAKDKVTEVVYQGVFPGAILEPRIQLEPAQTSVIHVRGPDDKPVAHQPIWISPVSTQPSGDYRLSHSTVDCTNAAGDVTFVYAPDVKASVQLTNRYPKEPIALDPEITITLTAEEVEKLLPVGRLEGVLLGADNKPAAGWQIVSPPLDIGSYNQNRDGPSRPRYAQPVKIGTDGKFVLEACYRELWLISPEGIPLRYELAPENWEAGTRKITLHVPPIRRIRHMEFYKADGSPLGNRTLSISPLGVYWHECFPTLAPACKLPTQRTDDVGKIDLPIFTGQRFGWGMYEPTCSFVGVSPFDDVIRATSQLAEPWQTRYEIPKEVKLITFKVVDGEGKFVDGYYLRAGPVGTANMRPFANVGDSRGVHRIVARDCKSVSVELTDPNNMQFSTKTYDLTDGDQTIRVAAPGGKAPEVPQPLKIAGRLLDSRGKPIADAEIGTHTVITRTDAGGKFALELSAREAPFFRQAIEAGRAPRLSLEISLPLWGRRCKVREFAEWSGFDNLQDLTIRIREFAGLKVLYPEELDRPTRRGPNLVCTRSLAPDAPQDVLATVFAGADSPGCLTGLFPPQKMFVQSMDVYGKAIPPFETPLDPVLEIEPMEVQLKAGEETVLDLRKHKLILPMLPQGRTTIAVLRDGKPVSGAVVQVYSTAAVPSDELAAAVGVLGASEYKKRSAAQATLEKAGLVALGVAIASADRSDLEVIARVEELSRKVNPLGRMLVGRVLTDLSDDAGTIGAKLQLGRRYIAVACLPGKAIGWAAFTAADKGTVTINLKPSVLLQLEANAGRLADPVSVKIPSLAPDEARAVLMSLGLQVDPLTYVPWVVPANRHRPWLCPVAAQWEPSGIWPIEDLPEGISLELSWEKGTPGRKTVKLETGKAAQKASITEAPKPEPKE